MTPLPRNPKTIQSLMCPFRQGCGRHHGLQQLLNDIGEDLGHTSQSGQAHFLSPTTTSAPASPDNSARGAVRLPQCSQKSNWTAEVTALAGSPMAQGPGAGADQSGSVVSSGQRNTSQRRDIEQLARVAQFFLSSARVTIPPALSSSLPLPLNGQQVKSPALNFPSPRQRTPQFINLFYSQERHCASDSCSR